MLRFRLLAWQKNSSIIDDFEQVGSGEFFLHKPSNSEFLTYAKYAPDSLPSLAQK